MAQPCKGADTESDGPSRLLAWRRFRARNHLACPFRAPGFVVFAYPGRCPWAVMGLPLRGAGESILSVTLRSPFNAAAGRRRRWFHPFRQTVGGSAPTPDREAGAGKPVTP